MCECPKVINGIIVLSDEEVKPRVIGERIWILAADGLTYSGTLQHGLVRHTGYEEYFLQGMVPVNW